ncbi:MAG: hypothetical protein AB8B74_10910 [Crocinitomicaceae bacterium]
MKLRILFLFALAIFLSCNKFIEEKLPEKMNPNLQHFGFTLIDVSWDDPTDKSAKVNYLDEVKASSNLADILVVEPTDDIQSRIQSMASSEVKAIIHLNEIFFENTGTGGTTSGFIYQLRSDYQTRWDEFILVNKLVENANQVAALYIGEEPAWNGISEADFTLATNYAKQTVPEIPILLVEAFAIVEDMYIPKSVDWVGFDHYFLKKPSENDEFLNEISTMKSKMGVHQRILLILDSHWIKIAHGSSGIAKADMDVVARDYYNMANEDTTVIGILGYYWPNGFEFKGALGARGLPDNVQVEYQQIGKSITGK